MQTIVNSQLKNDVEITKTKIKKSASKAMFENKNYVAGFREAFRLKIKMDMIHKKNKF